MDTVAKGIPENSAELATSARPRQRARSLAHGLVEDLSEKIRNQQLKAEDKLPTESALMQAYGVSRTVVREAISKLQAARLVETRHGIGTFVLGIGETPGFKITPDQVGTLQDVIAVLELRIGLETEAAALAAQRRTPANLEAMRLALEAVAAAVEAGQDAVPPDFQFHLEIARATQNSHFTDLMNTLGNTIIPRARLEARDGTVSDERRAYLRRVNGEHESILDAIAAQDADAARAAMRTHLANSRERRRRAQASLG
ncbi:FCD domain-containing protein [Paucibacter sp. R3-3]|uniref:FCD domain-containing protein n=1 Tax=Roseateles agri TaxID=3098619 RepID=A0ABU5DHK8_9BURK|nr:FCD domain-containing protein [Paucibacter sp. R3-3]MDY0745778.1 FCD domain-containing protein [Paucibacter sp. R3-3]